MLNLDALKLNSRRTLAAFGALAIGIAAGVLPSLTMNKLAGTIDPDIKLGF